MQIKNKRLKDCHLSYTCLHEKRPEHENEAGEDRIPNSNMAISKAEKSTSPVLLKESDFPEASLAERNQQS